MSTYLPFLSENSLFVCLFVTEEIPITVSWQAPDKEAWRSSYPTTITEKGKGVSAEEALVPQNFKSQLERLKSSLKPGRRFSLV